MSDTPADKPRQAEAMPLLDVRRAVDFEKAHRPGAVNVPLEELRLRMHELSPRDVALVLYDADSTRARWAGSRLRARGRTLTEIHHGPEWLHAGTVETGPSRARLWRPHALLVEAITLARRTWRGLAGRKALDLACGSGRDAVFTAMEGLTVEGWDILPDALERCADLARRNGVAVGVRRIDLEAAPPLQPNSFDLACCFSFLHRPLMSMLAETVRPGGLIVYETFVEPQRELFGKPVRESHVLRPGELAGWFRGWDIRTFREGLSAPRRFTASMIAMKPEPVLQVRRSNLALGNLSLGGRG